MCLAADAANIETAGATDHLRGGGRGVHQLRLARRRPLPSVAGRRRGHPVVAGMASEIRNRKSEIGNRHLVAGVQFFPAGEAGLQPASFALRRLSGDARLSVGHLPAASFAATLATKSTACSPQSTVGLGIGRGTSRTVDGGQRTKIIPHRHVDYFAGGLGAAGDSIRTVLPRQGLHVGVGRRPDGHLRSEAGQPQVGPDGRGDGVGGHLD